VWGNYVVVLQHMICRTLYVARTAVSFTEFSSVEGYIYGHHRGVRGSPHVAR
jgi:hypothetical protein